MKLNYFATVSTSNMNKVQAMQNNLLEMALKLDRLMPNDDLSKTTKILKIYHISKYRTLGIVNVMVSDL